MKDPDKVIPSSGNLVLIDLRVEDSGGHVPLARLDDLSLDLCDHSTIRASISGLLGERIVGIAHAVSCSIAPRTDRHPTASLPIPGRELDTPQRKPAQSRRNDRWPSCPRWCES